MESLEKVILLKKELDSLRPISKAQEFAIMQKFRLDWNYHSNHLEGNSLSFGETKALILFGITAQGKPLKDHFEITGHDEAVKWIEEVVKEERPLTEAFIRELHKLILKEPYEKEAITPEGLPTKKKIQIGQYKTTPNHVLTQTGEIFRFATPEETPAKMQELIEWFREKKEDHETIPLLLAAEFHYRFIRIHPFDDGNGRTARILMNFILMQYGYPPVIIKTEEKQRYLSALQQADAGMIDSFIHYIEENLIQSLELMIKGAKGESIDEPDDVEKGIALIEAKLKNLGKLSQQHELNRKTMFESFYQESFLPLITKFILENEKMKKLYEYLDFKVNKNREPENDYTFTVYSNSEIPNFVYDSLKATVDTIINSWSIEWSIMADFKNFKLPPNINLFNPNYSNLLTIEFNYDTYKVRNNYYAQPKVEIIKRYDEVLTTEEINSFVLAGNKAHQKRIEEEVDKLKNFYTD